MANDQCADVQYDQHIDDPHNQDVDDRHQLQMSSWPGSGLHITWRNATSAPANYQHRRHRSII